MIEKEQNARFLSSEKHNISWIGNQCTAELHKDVGSRFADRKEEVCVWCKKSTADAGMRRSFCLQIFGHQEEPSIKGRLNFDQGKLWGKNGVRIRIGKWERKDLIVVHWLWMMFMVLAPSRIVSI